MNPLLAAMMNRAEPHVMQLPFVVVSPRLTFLPPPPETHRRLGREDRRRLQFLSIFYGHEPSVVVSRLLAADMRRLARLPSCGPPI